MYKNDITELLEKYKILLNEDKLKLEELIKNDDKKNERHQHHDDDVDEKLKVQEENKENLNENLITKENQTKNCSKVSIDKLDLTPLNDEKTKRNYNLTSSFMSRSDEKRNTMLRYGEYSPNNPEFRVQSQPYLGIGEYEQQRNYILNKRRSIDQSSQQIQYDRENPNEAQKELKPQKVEFNSNNVELTSYRRTTSPSSYSSLMDGDLTRDMDKPKGILTNRKSGSPRDRFMSNLKHSYTPSFMDGFSYSDRTEELERERKKRESYNYELRMQIEEKRKLQSLKDEQDRREQELENRRLEQQLLRMQEEALIDEPKSSSFNDEQTRRHSDDYLRRRTELGLRSYRKHADSESSVLNNTTRLTSTSSSHYSPPVSRRNQLLQSSSLYTDPLSSRYNPHSSSSSRYEFGQRRVDGSLNRMDSINFHDNLYSDNLSTMSTNNSKSYNKKNAFARFDSLSRIDSLGVRNSYNNDTISSSNLLNKFDSLNLNDTNYFGRTQRRHSATQQDLRRSPKLQRRSNSGRFFDDQLPIPLLKARSPVARELKNSIPFNSGRNSSSEACRKLEDKWQIPAVQKTIINHHTDTLRDGSTSNRSILTQLGAIRMQLQQEQLRMDETLRKRGITQSKAVDFH